MNQPKTGTRDGDHNNNGNCNAMPMQSIWNFVHSASWSGYYLFLKFTILKAYKYDIYFKSNTKNNLSFAYDIS